MGDFALQTRRFCSHVRRVYPAALATVVLLVGWFGLELLDLESRRFVFRALAIGLALIGPLQNALPVILSRLTVWVAAFGVVWGLWYARDEGHFGVTWSAIWLLGAASWTLLWKFALRNRFRR